jgi:hypothetical protein
MCLTFSFLFGNLADCRCRDFSSPDEMNYFDPVAISQSFFAPLCAANDSPVDFDGEPLGLESEQGHEVGDDDSVIDFPGLSVNDDKQVIPR